MTGRDDFSAVTKEKLAKRVGYRCSFLGCGKTTLGPNDEDPNAHSASGMACHIAAASRGRGAKRYDENMTPEQRSDISNGIWMCYEHGKIIDTDEERFSTEVLKEWKEIAERVSRIMMEKGCEYKEALRLSELTKLPFNFRNVDALGNENIIIGDLINDSCIHIVWGDKLANTLRDYVIEHTRNAFKHGAATKFKLEIINNCISLYDNGKEYDPQCLINEKRKSGGVIAFERLLKGNEKDLAIVYQRKDNTNKTIISIIRTGQDIRSITECCVEIDYPKLHQSDEYPFKVSETCKEIYIVLSRYLSVSDVFVIKDKLTEQKEQRPLIFVAGNLSEGVIDTIKQLFPSSRILRTS